MNAALQPLDFGAVLELFLDLRGKGASLSGDDLQYLAVWKNRGVSPETIEKIIRGLDAECSSNGRPFPMGLRSIDKRVTKYLIELASTFREVEIT